MNNNYNSKNNSDKSFNNDDDNNNNNNNNNDNNSNDSPRAENTGFMFSGAQPHLMGRGIFFSLGWQSFQRFCLNKNTDRYGMLFIE